jgi:hypothetical protein
MLPIEAARTLLHFIDPGKPAQNAWIESFNARVRDAFLNVQMFRMECRVRSPRGSGRDVSAATADAAKPPPFGQARIARVPRSRPRRRPSAPPRCQTAQPGRAAQTR